MSLLERYLCSLVGQYGIISATHLKPDEGTPELPEGKVRVRLETDGSLHDVTEYEIEKVPQPFFLLDVCPSAVEPFSGLTQPHSSTVQRTGAGPV